MPFRVKKDTALPRVLRPLRDTASGDVYSYEVAGVAYAAGAVVAEEDIDPRLVERFKDGDEHLASLLEEVDDEQLEAANAVNKPAVVAEHEAEAVVQEEAGKEVVNADALLQRESTEEEEKPAARRGRKPKAEADSE